MIKGFGSELEERSKNYALKCHESTNHLYDGKSYKIHLEMVVDVAYKFIHIIPPEDISKISSAAWCHDIIEDTRQTYNDVVKNTNKEVADIVYALTNEKGKTREERANKKYYKGIRNTKYATYLKLCDRIANVEYSLNGDSRMYSVYKQENKKFLKSLEKSVINRILNIEPSYRVMTEYLKDYFKYTC